MRINTFLVAGLLVASVSGLALAHGEHGHGKAIDYRNSVMTIFKWNMGLMGAVVKGEAPYDQADFAKHAADLSAAAHLDLLAGFPEGSDEGDTGARPDIWMDWQGFGKKHDDLKSATAKLAEVAQGGDFAAVKAQFGAVGKACKSCHDAFKD